MTLTRFAIARLRANGLMLALATSDPKNPEFEEKIKRDALGRFAEKAGTGEITKDQVKALVDQAFVDDPKLTAVMDFFVDKLDLSLMKEGLKTGAAATPESQEEALEIGYGTTETLAGIKETLENLGIVNTEADSDNNVKVVLKAAMQVRKNYKKDLDKMKNLEDETEAVQQVARMAVIAAEAGTAIALAASFSYVAASVTGEATLAGLLEKLSRSIIQKQAMHSGKEVIKMTPIDDEFYAFLGFCIGSAIGKAYRDCLELPESEIPPELKSDMKLIADEMQKISQELAKTEGDLGRESINQLSDESKATVQGLGKAVKG